VLFCSFDASPNDENRSCSSRHSPSARILHSLAVPNRRRPALLHDPLTRFGLLDPRRHLAGSLSWRTTQLFTPLGALPRSTFLLPIIFGRAALRVVSTLARTPPPLGSSPLAQPAGGSSFTFLISNFFPAGCHETAPLRRFAFYLLWNLFVSVDRLARHSCAVQVNTKLTTV